MFQSSLSRHRRSAIIVALIAAVAALLVWRFAGRPGQEPDPAPGRTVWFPDLGPPDPVPVDEARSIVAGVRSVLGGGRLDDLRLGPRWERDRSPRVVFISVSGGRARARVFTGAGRGLRPAIEDAVRQTLSAAPSGAREAPRWLRVDLVTRTGDAVVLADGQPVGIDRSLRGLAEVGGSRVAILPGELVAHGVVDSRGRWRPSRLRSVRRASALESLDAGGRWLDFETDAYFHDGRDVVRLLRGRRREPDRTGPAVLAACRAAGDYLLRSLSSEGRFVYAWLPKSGTERDAYNLVRHAGTTYSLAELHGAIGDARYLDAAERAARHLLSHVEPFGPPEREMSALVSGDRVKLGGVALSVVALVELARVRGDRSRLRSMRRLARYIVDSQRSDGSFIAQRFWPSGAERKGFTSEYYPGEALLALLRLHSLDEDERWLDAAVKGARHLIETRDRDVPTSKLIHDHWLLYALDDLRRFRPSSQWTEHAMRISRAISFRQNRRPDPPDWIGSWYDPPRSTPTATRSEGLLAALSIARDQGLEQDALRIRETIDLAVTFQLRTQFRPETVLFLPDPRRALGGFHRSLTNYEIRIDYVQHNVSALLAYHELIAAEDTGRSAGSTTSSGRR